MGRSITHGDGVALWRGHIQSGREVDLSRCVRDTGFGRSCGDRIGGGGAWRLTDLPRLTHLVALCEDTS